MNWKLLDTAVFMQKLINMLQPVFEKQIYVIYIKFFLLKWLQESLCKRFRLLRNTLFRMVQKSMLLFDKKKLNRNKFYLMETT